MDEHLRLTDLIPRRYWVYAILLLAGLAAIAGVEALYVWMPSLAKYTKDGRVATFDLSSEGSLCSFLSSLLLLGACAVSLLVYLVRRHRLDDYQGQYRIWIWAALCWFIMAADEGAQLHEGFKELVTLVTGTRLFGDGSIWWVIPYFFLLGAVGLRLLLDMRECRFSTAVLALVAGIYAFSVVVHMNWFMTDMGMKQQMVEEGAELVGDLLLLLAMMLHARHVILEAEGQLSSAQAGEEADEAEIEWKEAPKPAVTATLPPRIAPAVQPTIKPPAAKLLIDPPHSVPAPASAAVRPVTSPALNPPTTAPANRKLTKAEKRALRARLMQMRQQREGG